MKIQTGPYVQQLPVRIGSIKAKAKLGGKNIGGILKI
jgi:hypothetical protein